MLLAHRSKLMAARSLEEALPCINRFSNEPAPEQLLQICRDRSDVTQYTYMFIWNTYYNI